MKSKCSIVLDRPLPGISASSLENYLERASRAAKVRGSVSVLIASHRKIRALNSKFRSKDSATDVLSFPSGGTNGSAGDIAICFDIAARNARELGHSLADEIRVLILHGILHLAGYDHEKDRGEMAEKEIALRTKLGLPTGLIERNGMLPTLRDAQSGRVARQQHRAKLAHETRRART